VWTRVSLAVLAMATLWTAPVLAQPEPFPDPFTPPVLLMPLTVQKVGTGFGTVSGVGIDCGGDCSHSYNRGLPVTLTATPTAPSTFTGWSGSAGCGGIGTCVVTMSQTHAVTATFTGPDLEIQFTDASPTSGGTAETNFIIERCSIIAPASSCSNFALLTSIPGVTGTGTLISFLDVNPGPSCYRAKAQATGSPDSTYTTDTGCWP